jgi:hypothetical protein
VPKFLVWFLQPPSAQHRQATGLSIVKGFPLKSDCHRFYAGFRVGAGN